MADRTVARSRAAVMMMQSTWLPAACRDRSREMPSSSGRCTSSRSRSGLQPAMASRAAAARVDLADAFEAVHFGHPCGVDAGYPEVVVDYQCPDHGVSSSFGREAVRVCRQPYFKVSAGAGEHVQGARVHGARSGSPAPVRSHAACRAGGPWWSSRPPGPGRSCLQERPGPLSRTAMKDAVGVVELDRHHPGLGAFGQRVDGVVQEVADDRQQVLRGLAAVWSSRESSVTVICTSCSAATVILASSRAASSGGSIRARSPSPRDREVSEICET